MAERVASVGGDLRITSPQGEGTASRAILPRRLYGAAAAGHVVPDLR
jgi:signal transduction histidine kinase